jgi:hypothetical protein
MRCAKSGTEQAEVFPRHAGDLRQRAAARFSGAKKSAANVFPPAASSFAQAVRVILPGGIHSNSGIHISFTSGVLQVQIAHTIYA